MGLDLGDSLNSDSSRRVLASEIYEAKLIENVQFIYELALAELELEAFGVKCTVSNSLRDFLLKDPSDLRLLIKRLAYIKTVGNEATDYYRLTRYNRTNSVNQYLTHWIYPYKGKFHPQMIRALLNVAKLGEGDTVLDPFIGSGTTALEAQLLGINSVGIDVSPLCVLQSKVKTESVYAVDQIKRLRQEAIESFRITNTAHTLLAQPTEKHYEDFLSSITDEKVRNFYLMARLVAISDEVRRRRDIVQSFTKNLDLMISSVEDHATVKKELNLTFGKTDIRQADARNLPLNDESVDGIITSPPYSIALDYVANDEHSFKAMGLDVDRMREDFVGVRGTGELRIQLYNSDMIRCFEEMHRVLKVGKYCVAVLGNATYQGKEVKTVEFTIEQCSKIGFRLLKNINKIIYGLYNVMQSDNTLIFIKER